MQRFRDSILVNGFNGLQPLPNAQVTVYEAGTSTLATLYSTNAKASQQNPFRSDSYGVCAFYAQDGRYDIKVESLGVAAWVRDVLLEDDATEVAQALQVSQEALDIANDSQGRAQLAASLAEGYAETAHMDAQAAEAAAGASGNDAELASSAAISAEYDADRAESARDAAMVGADLYPDEATGRAAVADGAFFKTVSADPNIAAELYQRIDENTSEPVTAYPSALSVQKNTHGVADLSEKSALLSAETLTEQQTIGTENEPIDGINASLNYTFVFDQAVRAPSYLTKIVVFGKSAGVLKIKRFSRAGDDFTFVRETLVSFGTGLNEIDGVKISSDLDLQPGDCVGFFQASGRISMTASDAGSPGYYPVNEDVTTGFTAGSLNTSNRLHIRFTFLGTSLPLNGMRGEYRKRLALLEDSTKEPNTQTVGTFAPSSGAAIAANRTYIINTPIAYPGYLLGLSVYASTAGTLKVKRFTKSGAVFTQQSEMVITLDSGLNSLLGWQDFPELDLQTGDYLGFFAVTARVAFNAVANNTPYFQPSGDATSYDSTGASPATNIRLEIGFNAMGQAPKGGAGNSPYANKVLVCLGDSITAFGDYPARIKARLGFAEVYNCGIGGTRLTKGTSNYDFASGNKLGAAIASGDWAAAIAGAAALTETWPAQVIELMSTLDWNTVDYISFFYGTNDFNGERAIGNDDDYDEMTFKGSFNLMVDSILAVYPHIKFVPIGPIWRSRMAQGDGKESDEYPNLSGTYLVEYSDAVIDMSARWHIKGLDLYRESGIGPATRNVYISSDGLHPEPGAGYEHLANKISAFISATY